MSSEIFRAPSHREITRIGETNSGIIIKASDGQFDRRGPQAKPRVTPWDEIQTQLETNKAADNSKRKSANQEFSSDTTIFKA